MDFSLTKATLQMWAFGWVKIPLIFFVRPTVLEMTEEKLVIRIPLSRRTRNHLGSMYFGALSIGADCTGAFLAYSLIQKEKLPIQLIFKDFHANFLKRAEGDTHFSCEDGRAIRTLIQKAAS